jgi:anti-sigma factor RsiW
MTCNEVCDFLDAYIDKELDVVSTSQFDRHLAECASCRARYDQYRQLHDATKAHMDYFRASEAFEEKIRVLLYPSSTHEEKASGREWFARWQPWAMLASAVAVLLVTAALFQMLRGRSASEIIAQQVVSSHIRSLQANHISDVASSDQHTVKPWFSGKLDFAPVVKDLSAKGFPLVGGRLDYLDGQAVAALVYKRRQHTINLFLWPSEAPDSGPRSLTIKGYNLVHWTHSQMTYWAVSDVNARDLSQFARDVQE